MKPLINLISRAFLALALCVSAPVASAYNLNKEIVAQEIRKKAMQGDLDDAAEAVKTYEDSPSTMEVVKLLIANGTDINAKYNTGYTYLHAAAVANYDKELETVKLLLDNGADVNVKDDVYGYTPLYIATVQWNAKVMQALIDYGSDIEATDNNGLTLLHYAVRKRFNVPEMAELLLDNGADVNAKREDGATPLHHAVSWGGRAKVTKLLLDKGADVNATDNDGRTPLHNAVWSPGREDQGRLHYIQLLIDAGADVNVIITSGRHANHTPLDLAAGRWGSVNPVSSLLIDNGAYCNFYSSPSPLCPAPPEPPEPQADYTGLYANAAFAVAGAFAPSWADTQTFAFNEGDKLVTGQSLSVPLDDFTFAAKRVQVNDLTDYEFSVKWEMEF